MDNITVPQLQRTTDGPTPHDVRLLRRRIITDSGCWEYNGARCPKGYGSMTVGSLSDGSRRVRRAHSVAYETWVGPVPEGKELDHLCRNPSCFNPAHLEPVTHRVNIQRACGGEKECKRGHKRTTENTIVDPKTGWRKCRVCDVARLKRRSTRNREQ